LDTLELVAKGLNSELLLIPKEKVLAVKAALEGTSSAAAPKASQKSLSDDPWQDMLEDDA
jgi:hypothetical protein